MPCQVSKKREKGISNGNLNIKPHRERLFLKKYMKGPDPFLMNPKSENVSIFLMVSNNDLINQRI